MKNTEDHFISDEHFDVLLRHALLEKDKMFNAQTLETMANQAFSLVNVSAISETKGESIIEKLTADFKSGGSKFRLNIFLLSLFTLATITGVIFLTSQKKEIIANPKQVIVASKDNEKFEPIPTIKLDGVNGNPLPRTNPMMIALLDSADADDTFSIQDINNGDPYTVPTTLHIPEDNILHYEDIPTLTETEKKQTQTDKMKMIRDISKKKTYCNLPPGKTNYKGNLQAVDGFSIEKAEVTNLEYRTFLNDLLIQGNFDDYLSAKPVAGGWKSVGIPEFENDYFENPTYNNFPAVNMTRKAAELYCAWLTKAMKDAIDRKEVKWDGDKAPDFRLPTDLEWIYAARACDSIIQTPWEKYAGKNTLQNKTGCYLCNFNYSASREKVAPEGPQMNKNNSKGCVAAKMSTRAIVTTAARAIDTLLTAPVYSYNPNDIGLYCTLGNVSEMAWTFDAKNLSAKGEARSMGGSWMSEITNVLIDAPEQYVGVTDAKPFIGFRPLMNGYYHYSMIKKIRL